MSKYYRIKKERLEGMGVVIRGKLDETEKYTPQTMIDKVNGMKLGGDVVSAYDGLRFGAVRNGYGINSLGSGMIYNSTGYNATVGSRLRANYDLNIIGVRYISLDTTTDATIDKVVKIWDLSGNLLASASSKVSSVDEQWVELLLDEDLFIPAGTEFILTFYSHIFKYTPKSNINYSPDISFVHRCWISGNTFPGATKNGSDPPMVDIILGDTKETADYQCAVNKSDLDTIARSVMRIVGTTDTMSFDEVMVNLKSITT